MDHSFLAGISGTGKTTVAEAPGKQLGIPWVQVDDLRLILQYSGLVASQTNPDLFYFLEHDQKTIESHVYRDKLIAVGSIVSRSLKVIVDHHVLTKKPLILEGDGIIPEQVAHYAATNTADAVRSVYVTEDDENVLMHNMLDCGRMIFPDGEDSESNYRTHIHGSWLYGKWLQEETAKYHLP